MKSTFHQNLLIILLATLFLAACAISALSGTGKKQVYIDANLLFSISYPEAWAPFLTMHGPANYAADAVSWQVRTEHQSTVILSLTVFSIPKNGFITELDLLKEVLLDIYPNATFSASGTDDLPAGLAIVLDGTSSQLTFRAWILNKRGRHYLIVCTASPEKFTENVPLFRTITDSFQVLKTSPHDQTD